MISWLLCLMGCHHWSDPGGHCLDCGKCDEFFHSHVHCREEAAAKAKAKEAGNG